MGKILSCIVYEHDIRMVVLAAVVCLCACLAVFRIYARIGQSRGTVRAAWLLLAGLAGGAGVWTTHFVAMLAYRPDTASGYAPGASIASLMISIAMTGCAFALASAGRDRLHRAAGGAVFGLGVGAMHFTGMAAYKVQGVVFWDHGLVLLSLGLGVAVAIAALTAPRRIDTFKGQLTGAGMLTLAIVLLHFIAMAAVTVAPMSNLPAPDNVMPVGMMAFAVTALAALVIFGGLGAAQIDAHADRSAVARLRGLANAAREGIVVLRDGRILETNTAFEQLCGRTAGELVGRKLHGDLITLDEGFDAGSVAREGLLARPGQDATPVEVTLGDLAGYTDEGLTVASVHDLRERRAAEAQVRYFAEHDELTGLPNGPAVRSRLGGLMDRSKASGERLAVFRLDLEHFSAIRNRLGSDGAEAAVIEAARRLREAAPSPGIAARIGAEEFAVVQIAPAERVDAVGELAARLLDALAAPYLFDGHELDLSTTIGVALYPEDARTADTLLSRADSARRRAREAGTGFSLFKREMDQVIHQRRDLSRELAAAIGADELVVYYQPVAGADCGGVLGFEALVRWNHPQRGLLPPIMFVPLAEETGLVGQLGEWVLRSACAEAASWPTPLRIAVNLSPLQLHQTDLPATVRSILAETGLDPARLELEITETALFKDEARAVATLEQLKTLGVRIAMDDFGTGFSSLSSLNAFPFDKIKIDKSFVQNIHDPDPAHNRARGIVRAVLGLGRSLGAPVVAEGVECAAQLAFLKNEGCPEIQGYFIGRPAPIAQFAALVGRESAAPKRRRPRAVAA